MGKLWEGWALARLFVFFVHFVVSDQLRTNSRKFVLFVVKNRGVEKSVAAIFLR